MDNIIKFLNLEDSDVELVSQRIEKKRRIVTIQKKIVPHFCPVCSYRMHSKGVYPRTINHPIMQDDLQLVLIVNQRRWQCTMDLGVLLASPQGSQSPSLIDTSPATAALSRRSDPSEI